MFRFSFAIPGKKNPYIETGRLFAVQSLFPLCCIHYSFSLLYNVQVFTQLPFNNGKKLNLHLFLFFHIKKNHWKKLICITIQSRQWFANPTIHLSSSTPLMEKLNKPKKTKGKMDINFLLWTCLLRLSDSWQWFERNIVDNTIIPYQENTSKQVGD